MHWTKARVVGDTLALSEDQMVPLSHGGSMMGKAGRKLNYGPDGWEPPTDPTANGEYEAQKNSGGFVRYNLKGRQPAVFPFQPDVPNEPGVVLIAMSDPE